MQTFVSSRSFLRAFAGSRNDPPSPSSSAEGEIGSKSIVLVSQEGSAQGRGPDRFRGRLSATCGRSAGTLMRCIEFRKSLGSVLKNDLVAHFSSTVASSIADRDGRVLFKSLTRQKVSSLRFSAVSVFLLIVFIYVLCLQRQAQRCSVSESEANCEANPARRKCCRRDAGLPDGGDNLKCTVPVVDAAKVNNASRPAVVYPSVF